MERAPPSVPVTVVTQLSISRLPQVGSKREGGRGSGLVWGLRVGGGGGGDQVGGQ